jgi:hypothetical protein
MRVNAPNPDVEALLTRAARARLPLGRQFLLYLDPFALFKDASCGSAAVREDARSYNRSKRWLLLVYIRRWLAIGAGSFLGVMPMEAYASQSPLFLLSAAGLGLGFCIAITIVVATGVAYLLLGLRSR